jgi:hypothetical protein
MTLTEERVELKERATPAPTPDRTGPQRSEQHVEPRPTEHAPKPAPTHNRSLLGPILGVAVLLAAAIAIAVGVTRGNNEPEPSIEADLPTIAAEDWVLPEVSIPAQVRVPADQWTMPEMNVADGTDAAALANLSYELPQMNVTEAEALAWADNYELPQMNIAEAEALAWADNYELPEMNIADGQRGVVNN